MMRRIASRLTIAVVHAISVDTGRINDLSIFLAGSLHQS